jgi:hypothetical protein
VQQGDPAARPHKTPITKYHSSAHGDDERHKGERNLRTDSRGSRIVKDQKHSARRVDLAVAAVMAYDRARDLARRPKPSILVG